MKICIKQGRGNSGTDVWAKSLCSELKQLGHGCHVDLYSPSFRFLPFFIRRDPDPGNCDIVQGNSWDAFAFKGNKPLVVTEHLVVHDPAYDLYRTVFQKIFHRWIYRCESLSLDAAEAVVCVSEYTRKELERAFGYADSQVIHNGVETELFRQQVVDRKAWNIPENKTVLLFTGNLTRRKGADLLPAIMNNLGDDYVLLTTSGNRDQSQRGIPHSRDLGHLDLHQLIEAYNLCDIFLIPSRLEGLSLSTLEAMSCGKPVIAFNCSSFPELIVDGRGGFLSEKDNVKDLVERIRYLSQEPDLVRCMGRFNRDRVLQKFTLSRMTNEYLRLYQSLLS